MYTMKRPGARALGIALIAWLAGSGVAALATPAQVRSNVTHLVITSDPQYPRTRTSGNDRPGSEARINAQYQSIVGYKNSAGLTTVPVMVNGDITEFGHDHERSFMYGRFDHYRNQGLNFYLGLGNHDYENNVNDCSANSCARRSIRDFLDFMRNRYSIQPDYMTSSTTGARGSMSYAFDYGDFHIVQLNNYPSYTNSFYAGGTNPLNYYITATPVQWLDDTLRRAQQAGKLIVVNLHDLGKLDSHYRSILMRYDNIVAVFAGHTHSAGQKTRIQQKIRTFDSGAAFMDTWLVATYTHSDRKFRVHQVSNNDYRNRKLLHEREFPPPPPVDFGDASIDLYKHDNGGGTRLCTKPLHLPDADQGASAFYNFKAGGGCANDDARSVVIRKAKAGSEIQLMGEPGGGDSQGKLMIEVRRDILSPRIISGFESSGGDADVILTRTGGGQQLTGKVSSMRLYRTESVQFQNEQFGTCLGLRSSDPSASDPLTASSCSRRSARQVFRHTGAHDLLRLANHPNVCYSEGSSGRVGVSRCDNPPASARFQLMPPRGVGQIRIANTTRCLAATETGVRFETCSSAQAQQWREQEARTQ